MNKTNYRLYAALTLLLIVSVIGISLTVDAYSGNGPKVVVEGDYIESQATAQEATIGSVSSPYIYSDVTVFGTLKSKEATYSLANGGTIYATTTLNYDDSGTTYLLSGTGTTIILPDVSMAGNYFKFVINGASAIGNWIIDSAEGDNIEGTLIVAGAVVDCDAEDQINFVVDGENLGDYFEIYSDGTQWLLGDSGVLTTAKLTCTDPD